LASILNMVTAQNAHTDSSHGRREFTTAPHAPSPSSPCKHGHASSTAASHLHSVMRPPLRVARLRQPWLLPRHPRSTPQSLVPRRIATTCARHAAPVDLPRLSVKHGSPGHNSMTTFMEYATRTKMQTASTVYVGTHYEYTTALALMRLGFSLLRTGSWPP
jgi:hypothetical protein